MKQARVYVHTVFAGILTKQDSHYIFVYDPSYAGPPVSLTMPVSSKEYRYDAFPPFFEGLLPEGELLQALLHKYKLDKHDYFAQLVTVGKDVVGAVTVEEMESRSHLIHYY